MLRKFVADLAFVQVLNLLVKPVWILIIDRSVQNFLTQEEYGAYFALFNFSLLFFIVLDFGITSFNVNELTASPKKFKKQFGSLFGLKFMLSLLYLFFLFVVGGMMGYTDDRFSLLLIIAGVQILTSFNQYFRSSVTAFQHFRTDGFFMVLDRILMIIICAVLLWGGISGWEMTIERFAWAQLLSLLTVSLVLLGFITRRIGRIRFSFKLKSILPLLQKTWPYGLLVAQMGLFNYLDGVMLDRISAGGAEDAGVYAMGYRLYFATFMFAQIFSNILLPMYGKFRGQMAKLRDLCSYAMRLLLLVGVALALSVHVYGEQIMDALYPLKNSLEASRAFSLLMYAFLGSVLVLVYGTYLTSARKLRFLNISAFATLILNLVLNFKLIPEHGVIGAAYATLISQLVFGLACWWSGSKALAMSLDREMVLRMIVGLLLLFIGIFILSQYIPSMLVHLVMITLTILITAYVFKLFGTKGMRPNP